jgi:hypothetical protein
MLQTTSPDGTQPLVAGSPPYNAPSLFKRSHYLSALIALCAVSRRALYVLDGDKYRCLTEFEVGAVRPKTLGENLGVPFAELRIWLQSALNDGYISKVIEPPVFLSAALGSPLVIVKASCLGVAWLGSWRAGKAL